MSKNVSWTKRPLDYVPPEVDTSVPHSARIYDYILGGKDNYPPDRKAAERILDEWPAFATTLIQSRRYMERVIRYLAAERGVDQFLDLGTGIPTSPNLHEIAQEHHPAARVVYVDNDPVVLAHAQALLSSKPEGRVAYIHADLRRPEEVLDAPEFAAALDLDRPVAVTVLTVLQLIPDDQEVCDLIGRYMSRLPAGSFLALSAGTAESNPDRIRAAANRLTADGIPIRSDRTRADVARFFAGLDLVDPGIVLIHRWHPDAGSAAVDDSEISQLGGVGEKR